MDITTSSNKFNAKKTVENIAQEIKKELTEQADIDLGGVDIVGLTAMISEEKIKQFDDAEYPSMKEILPKLISGNDNQSFIVNDIGAVIRQYRLWKEKLPGVGIFYAVKCNSDPILLKTLYCLGVSFDVASEGEISLVTDLDPKRERRDKIIYANPCKDIEHIKFARSQQISMMTFDNIIELLKIKLFHPDAELVLRILVDDSKSKMPFGSKFGCPMNDIKNVLVYAKFLELNVTGVSFHVGSCCIDASAYSDAIKRAKTVFDIAKDVGFNFNFLDVGGGMSNSNKQGEITFDQIAIEINRELKDSFGSHENLRVIAEPGRFFAASTFTLVVSIIGKKLIIKNDTYNVDPTSKKRKRHEEDTNSMNKKPHIDEESSDMILDDDINKEHKVFHYTINSSIYGMFNNIIFDKAVPEFKLLNEYNDKKYKSVLFGQTCDSADTIVTGICIPELACGDKLYVEDHGAYTSSSAAPKFNGFKPPVIIPIFTY